MYCTSDILYIDDIFDPNVEKHLSTMKQIPQYNIVVIFIRVFCTSTLESNILTRMCVYMYRIKHILMKWKKVTLLTADMIVINSFRIFIKSPGLESIHLTNFITLLIVNLIFIEICISWPHYISFEVLHRSCLRRHWCHKVPSSVCLLYVVYRWMIRSHSSGR